MPSPTYVALAKTVLTGSQTTITFSSIPSTYTDLVLLVSARDDAAGTPDIMKITFNSTTTNYSSTYLAGDPVNGAYSNRETNSSSISYLNINGNTATSNTFGNTEIYIPNYAGSTNKPVSVTGVTENNATNASTAINANAGLWRNTAAINEIKIVTFAGGGNFLSGSRFDLYGIKNS